jgi:hypothetical protein
MRECFRIIPPARILRAIQKVSNRWRVTGFISLLSSCLNGIIAVLTMLNGYVKDC